MNYHKYAEHKNNISDRHLTNKCFYYLIIYRAIRVRFNRVWITTDVMDNYLNKMKLEHPVEFYKAFYTYQRLERTTPVKGQYQIG